MTKLTTFFAYGQHHFLLLTGKKTALGSPAGVWASYIPPSNGNKGVLTMLYATKESRHYAAHVLGALGIHAINTYQELPEGSHDLSPHSLPLQKRLAVMLGQLPATAAVNQENWFKSVLNVASLEALKNIALKDGTARDISQDIESGKQFLLDVIGGRVTA